MPAGWMQAPLVRLGSKERSSWAVIVVDILRPETESLRALFPAGILSLDMAAAAACPTVVARARAAGLLFRSAFTGRLQSAGRAAPTCRTPLAVATPTFLQPMMRTRALVEGGRPCPHRHTRPIIPPISSSSASARKICCVRLVPAMRRRSRASGPFAPIFPLGRDGCCLPMHSLPWHGKRVSNRGQNLSLISIRATWTRSATRCVAATFPACNGS